MGKNLWRYRQRPYVTDDFSIVALNNHVHGILLNSINEGLLLTAWRL